MPIELRGTNVYFYHARRVGGRVAKQYAGAGQVAIEAAQADAEQREQRRRAADAARVAMARIAAETARYAAWLTTVNGIVGGALRASGFRRVNRQWRLRKGAIVRALTMNELVDGATPSWVGSDLEKAAGPLDDAVLAKAKAGDRAAKKALDAYFAQPAARCLWGDLGRRVLERWAGTLTGGKNPEAAAAIIAFAADLRARLAGPSPTALDVLLAERTTIAWVFASWADLQFVGRVGDADAREEGALLKRIELASRNLLASCRALAKVRRARLPEIVALVNVQPPGVPAGDGPRPVVVRS